MIIAEELNINSKNVDDFKESENKEILRLLGLLGPYGTMIELDDLWAYQIIKHVGNYEESFNRNLGSESLLKLNRGFNRLYTKGGLLYAPPFRWYFIEDYLSVTGILLIDNYFKKGISI